jgi:thiamine kinase-like enzyme
MAQSVDPKLAQLLLDSRTVHPFCNSHRREIEIHYLGLASIRELAPQLLGSLQDEEKGQYVLIQEYLQNVTHLNSMQTGEAWTSEHVSTALQAVAAVHREARPRLDELRQKEWLQPLFDGKKFTETQELWLRLNRISRKRYEKVVDADFFDFLDDKIFSTSLWWDPYIHQNQTLIHNDFNPRNLAFRKRDPIQVLAFDWELATIGAPQRDAIELLSFIIHEGHTDEQIRTWLLEHRAHVQKSSVQALSEEDWLLRAEYALYDFAIHRLSMYSVPAEFGRANYVEKVYGNLNRLFRNREYIFR